MKFFYHERIGKFDNSFLWHLFLNLMLCKFFFAFTLTENIYGLFEDFFKSYVKGLGMYVTFLSYSDNFLLNDEHRSGFSRLKTVLITAEERDFFVKEEYSLNNILTTFFNQLFVHDSFSSPVVNNFFFLNSLKSGVFYKKNKKRNNFDLLYNVVALNVIYYLSNFFFNSFIHMECYLFPDAVSFLDVIMSKLGLVFAPIEDIRYDSVPEKLTIDMLL